MNFISSAGQSDSNIIMELSSNMQSNSEIFQEDPNEDEQEALRYSLAFPSVMESDNDITNQYESGMKFDVPGINILSNHISTNIVINTCISIEMRASKSHHINTSTTDNNLISNPMMSD